MLSLKNVMFGSLYCPSGPYLKVYCTNLVLTVSIVDTCVTQYPGITHRKGWIARKSVCWATHITWQKKNILPRHACTACDIFHVYSALKCTSSNQHTIHCPTLHSTSLYCNSLHCTNFQCTGLNNMFLSKLSTITSSTLHCLLYLSVSLNPHSGLNLPIT